MRYIIGLGNPGEQYAGTRHNFGFRVVDHLALLSGGHGFRRQGSYLVRRTQLDGVESALVKPQTFMNVSGAAVREILSWDREAEVDDLLLVYDDLDLPLGRIRVRPGGSHGGHRGVMSVLDTLGTRDVARVRMGIRPPSGVVDDPIGFVLNPFDRDEQDAVDEMVKRAADAVVLILTEGMAKAQNLFNRAESSSGKGDDDDS